MMRPVLHVVLAYGDIYGLDYEMAEMSNQCAPKRLHLVDKNLAISHSFNTFNSQCTVYIAFQYIYMYVTHFGKRYFSAQLISRYAPF